MGVGLPLSFFENRKKAPQKSTLTSEKSGLFLCIYGLILIQNTVLRDLLEKNTKTFPCGAFLLYLAHETFIEVLQRYLSFQRYLPFPKKFLVAHLWLDQS